MRADPQPHFQLPQLVAHPVDERMNAEPIQRALLELEVQVLPVAHQARILPARLAKPAVMHLRFDSREKEIELVNFRAKLAKIRPTVPAVPLVTRIISPAIFNGV